MSRQAVRSRVSRRVFVLIALLCMASALNSSAVAKGALVAADTHPADAQTALALVMWNKPAMTAVELYYED